MWSDALGELVAFAILASAALLALTAIGAKLALTPKWSKDRVKSWLDQTIGEVVEARLTGRNGGSSLMDSIDRIELEIRQLHGSHAEITERVDRLSSDVATLRMIADERGESAKHRDDVIERRLDQLTDALIGARRTYEPVDVTRTRPQEDTP
jgi:hypothetical protein